MHVINVMDDFVLPAANSLLEAKSLLAGNLLFSVNLLLAADFSTRPMARYGVLPEEPPRHDEHDVFMVVSWSG